MFNFKETSALKKSNKQEVNVTVCYYHIEENKDRYVLFFYDPTEKAPIYKWVYYLMDNNFKDFKKKYQDLIKEKNFSPNKTTTLCMCNQSTKINTIKLPKKLKYTLNYKKFISGDLADKLGDDYKKSYLVDNQVDGVLEAKAEKVEKHNQSIAKRRMAKVQKYRDKISQEEIEYNFDEPKTPNSKFRKLLFVFIGLTIVMVGLAIAFILYCNLQKPIKSITLGFHGLFLLYVLTVVLMQVIRKKKGIKYNKRAKRRLTYKNALDIYYAAASAVFLYFSEFIAYFLLKEKNLGILRDIYGIFIFSYLISIIVIEHIKRKKLSKLCTEMKRIHIFGPKMIIYNEGDEFKDPETIDKSLKDINEDEEKLFNMSNTKRKVVKNKKAASVIAYRQLLVPRDSYKAAAKICSMLNLKITNLRTLPSLIASFHRKYSKGVNEVVVYNEAGFTLLVGFVNDTIVESLFFEPSGKQKNKEGEHIGFHLSSFKNIFSSLLYTCQGQTNKMERVVYISNSEKNISDFKGENLFGLPYEIVGDTDIVFGETVKKAKQMTALMNAFTLVETVVAMAIFSIIVSMVATLMVSISNFNLKAQQTTKAAIYINNVREALNTDINNIKQIAVVEEFTDGVKGKYYLNSDFEVFKASAKQVNQTYMVQYSMSVNEYTEVSQPYTDYVFTILKVMKIGSTDSFVNATRIEVVK